MSETQVESIEDLRLRIHLKEGALVKYQDMLSTQREVLNHLETKILLMYRELVDLYREFYQDEAYQISRNMSENSVSSESD